MLVPAFMTKGSVHAQLGTSGCCGKGSGAQFLEVRQYFDCSHRLTEADHYYQFDFLGGQDWSRRWEGRAGRVRRGREFK